MHFMAYVFIVLCSLLFILSHKIGTCLNLGGSSDTIAETVGALIICFEPYHFGMHWMTLTSSCQCLCLKAISKASERRLCSFMGLSRSTGGNEVPKEKASAND